MEGFYLGIYLPELNQGIKPVQLRTIERGLRTRFRILSLYQAWGPESLERFPETLLREVHKKYPRDCGVLWHLSEVMFRHKRYAEAVAVLEGK